MEDTTMALTEMVATVVMMADGITIGRMIEEEEAEVVTKGTDLQFVGNQSVKMLQLVRDSLSKMKTTIERTDTLKDQMAYCCQ